MIYIDLSARYTVPMSLNFQNFNCLQGKCPLSCCCGWRIGLDEETEARWRALDQKLNQSWFAALDCVGPEGFQVCLLGQDEAGCCHLMDENGLCIPHRQQGETYKPETCRRFPMITIPATSQSSLSLACPEVGRLLLEGNVQDSDIKLDNFKSLQSFASGMFVDWHEPEQLAASRLWDWVYHSLPSGVWPALGLTQPSKTPTIESVLSTLMMNECSSLQRYYQQSALHLGLPDHAYGGETVASLVQLVVLLLGLCQVLHICREQGLVLDTAKTGLAIAYIERQWGHPSSGMDLVEREPWLAQLDWREPLLGQLVSAQDA